MRGCVISVGGGGAREARGRKAAAPRPSASGIARSFVCVVGFVSVLSLICSDFVSVMPHNAKISR